MPLPLPVPLLDPQLPVNPVEAQQNFAALAAGFPPDGSYYAQAGDLKMSVAATAPPGWLACDGSSVLRSQYASLFTVIGTAFGSVDGTHFTLPDFRGRAPVGVGNGDATGHTNHIFATKYGEETHVLSAAESGLPAHSHTRTVATGGGATVDGGAIPPHNAVASSVKTITDTSSAAAASSAHENRTPSLAVNILIKT